MVTENSGCEILPPILSIFLESLRDIGYDLKTSVADIVDNSIAAGSRRIGIYALPSRMTLAVTDDGRGMSVSILKEAMRLGTQKPVREETDLGRFGLGLKTASFSQCRRLTVISKDQGSVNAFSWDLDVIAEKNDWLLQRADSEAFGAVLDELSPDIRTSFDAEASGSIILWEKIDRYSEEDFGEQLSRLRSHLALVFHRYLSPLGFKGVKTSIAINGTNIKLFNPFTSMGKDASFAMQNAAPETKTLSDGRSLTITRHILPPLNRLSEGEYKLLGTEAGFTRSQGFYLFRRGRLLVWGSWFGLATISDASNLVRIEIDIDTDQDDLWKIDVKKSMATPVPEIRKILKHYTNVPIEKSRRTHKATGIKAGIENAPLWLETHVNDVTRFGINFEHPRLKEIMKELPAEQRLTLRSYLSELSETLPMERIHYQMTAAPHEVESSSFDLEFLEEDVMDLKKRGKSKETAKALLLADSYYAGHEKEILKLVEKIYEQHM